MKPVIIAILFLCVLVSCQKEINIIDNSVNPLIVGFEYAETKGNIVFLNKCSKSVSSYELKVNDKTISSGAIKDTLGQITYTRNGKYHAFLKVTNNDEQTDSLLKDIFVTNAELVNPIDTSILVSPSLNFAYEILDSGFVQFYNQSTNYDSFHWSIGRFPTLFQDISPKFRFQSNGIHDCTLVLLNNNLVSDTTFKINIQNAIKLDKDRFIEGVLFSDNVKFVSSNNDYVQNYSGGGLDFSFIDRRCGKVEIYESDNTTRGVAIKIGDCNQEQSLDLNTFRKNLTKGLKSFIKLDSSGKWSFGWGITIYYQESDKSPQIYYGNGNNPNDFLEITEVKEVYQPYLFPNHESTAFLVTFHFKTITKEGKKIDLKIPVKYMAYKEDEWY